MRYFCQTEDRKRRAALEGHSALNGIDFVEVRDLEESDDTKRQRFLELHFINPLTSTSLKPANIRITGGERIPEPAVVDAPFDAGHPDWLMVEVATPGDFSLYCLSLITAQGDAAPIEKRFDPLQSTVEFSFKVECAADFDCRLVQECPPEPVTEPAINYLAKDYNSFRQLLIDRMALLMPGWKERSAADMGMMLVELLAYVGDYLSYQQDAIATEAYLGTARERISARRHVRLIDYFMHDGCNARAWVQIALADDVPDGSPVTVLKGSQLLTGLPGLPPRLAVLPDLTAFDPGQTLRPTVFETMHDAMLYHEHNEIQFYTWGEEECCLPRGATRASLRGKLAHLQPGDVLVFQEKLGPQTGREADADPTHRHAVRLRSVGFATDPLADRLTNGSSDVTEIEWVAGDALPFPLCVSGTTDEEHGAVFYPAVSVALGNIVLADHGQTVADHGQTVGDKSFTFRGRPGKPVLPRQRPRLRQGPVSQRIPYMHPTSAPFPSAVATLRQAPVDALPDAWLQTDQASGAPHWEPKRDLLGSDDTVLAWVGEVDDDGIMAIRFGDDQHGRRPALGTGFYATYRVGNGAAGNVGYEAIAHIISTDPSVKGATNPLPAQGGADPESISDVRQRASSAFRTQQRAVTAQDYADRAATLEDSEGLAEVQRAAASFRWTGSWHTVFTTVDRVGGKRVEEGDFEKRMRDWLDLYRMAGHDVEIENPRLVSLEIAMQVCVKPDYFKSPVEQELKRVFGTGLLPDGRRAVFHPDNFTFGQTLYLSSLYAAAQAVAGVASVKITKFQRQGIDSNEAIDSGKLVLGRLEVARLENSPNFPERGHFDLVVEGGK